MNELVTQSQHTNLIEFRPEQVELLKNTVCKGATDDELKLFMHVANRTGLDPFAKQIYAVKRWDSKLNRDVMTIQTGIDGFRLTAARTKKYQGQLGPFWCGADGVWTDVWLQEGYPFAAKVGVLHLEFKEPLWGVARWDSYVQTYKNKQGKYEVAQFWNRMPDVMIAKVAEALALRKAFPADLSGIYVTEEMNQASNELPTETKTESAPKFTIGPKLPNYAPTSQPVLKEIRDTAKTRGWANEQVAEFMLAAFKKDNSKLLSIDEANELLSIIRSTNFQEAMETIHTFDVEPSFDKDEPIGYGAEST